METFWKNCEDTEQILLILLIIPIIISYIDTYYKRILCQILYLSNKKYVENLTQ